MQTAEAKAANRAAVKATMTKLEETEAADGAAALTTILAGAAVAKLLGQGLQKGIAVKATVARQKGSSKRRQLLEKRWKTEATLVNLADLSGHDH